MKKTTDCKELALKKVNISGNVIGKFGTFEIEQTFVNNTKKVLEVGYTFPIVETATVVGFEVIVGDKIMKGQCKEKAEAKKEYQKNIVKGNSAYLLEEESDNIFSITIGKLAKNEEVTVKIKFIDKFEIVDNQIQVIIPTLVPPKYKSQVTARLHYGEVKYNVDFNINIPKTLGINNITSTTHELNLSEDEKNTKVEVIRYDMSTDFKLNIGLKEELSSTALIAKNSMGEDILYLSFMPEIVDSYEDSEKEYVFVIDVSGSMDGEKIEETKRAVIECLKQLDDGDTFNIIPFSHEFEAMNVNALEYNEYNLKNAIKYVKSLEADGGTEILEPLKFSLYEKDTEKIILLFTDGEVGNEDEIISFVEENIGKSRIFPFGIDMNVNTFFIRELAEAGQGKAELIMPGERIDDKIIRTFARIQTPLLEDLTIDYGNNKVLDEIRESQTLFNYEYYNAFVKIEKLVDDITLKGHIFDNEYFWAIKKEDAVKTAVDLEVLFAKEEINRLEAYIRNSDDEEDENYKKMIVDIAEKYNINSKYTSFITVYERENKIHEVPLYQQTTLSSKNTMYARGSVACMSSFFDVFKSGGDEACDEACCFNDIGMINELDPDFLEDKDSGVLHDYFEDGLEYSCRIKGRNAKSKQKETYNDKLRAMMEKYCDTLVISDKETLITYLMYIIYLLYVKSPKFNYKKLLQTLEQNKSWILLDEICQQLITGIYKGLTSLNIKNSNNIIEFLNDSYKKAAITNMKMSIKYELDKLDIYDIKNIVESDDISAKIDSVIEYFYSPDNALNRFGITH